MSIYDWKAALSRFAIQFEEQTEQLPTQTPFTQNSGCPLLWIMWSVRDGVEPNRFCASWVFVARMWRDFTASTH